MPGLAEQKKWLMIFRPPDYINLNVLADANDQFNLKMWILRIAKAIEEEKLIFVEWNCKARKYIEWRGRKWRK